MWEASWERNSAVIKSEWKGKPAKNKEQRRRSKYETTTQHMTGAGFNVKDTPPHEKLLALLVCKRKKKCDVQRKHMHALI